MPSTSGAGNRACSEPSRMIAIVSGTNRPGSATLKVAGHVRKIHALQGAGTSFFDLHQLPAGLFEPSSYAEKPAAFKPWCDQFLRASGLVFVIPEYNGGFPGALKYFYDLLPFPAALHRKPVCLIGLADGEFGALRSVEQFAQLLIYRQAHVYPERVFIPRIGPKLDPDGQLTDPEITRRLAAQAQGFREFQQALSTPSTEPAHS